MYAYFIEEVGDWGRNNFRKKGDDGMMIHVVNVQCRENSDEEKMKSEKGIEEALEEEVICTAQIPRSLLQSPFSPLPLPSAAIYSLSCLR